MYHHVSILGAKTVRYAVGAASNAAGPRSVLIPGFCGPTNGATENAGVENAARAKMQGWKMQE